MFASEARHISREFNDKKQEVINVLERIRVKAETGQFELVIFDLSNQTIQHLKSLGYGVHSEFIFTPNGQVLTEWTIEWIK